MSDYSTIVLFADLSGSVQLYESLGDAEAKSIVVSLQNKLANCVLDNSGIVHEVIGDEIMCRFEQAVHAINCAERIHQCAAEHFTSLTGLTSGSMHMRIGIHCGTAILDGERLFGDTVNTAARITSIAQAGQTITTQAVLDMLPPDLQNVARVFDNTTLKGKAESMVVYDFPWQLQGLTRINELAVTGNTASLQLLYNDQTFLLAKSNCPSILGRAVNNFIVVDNEPVSRRHVSIEFQRGRFVLSDISTNGTHVYPDNGEAIYLRREQIPLWGTGSLSLGAPAEESRNQVIKYCCEPASGSTPLLNT